MKNAEQPAFPVYENNGLPFGLTKREHFASMCLQGALSNPKVIENMLSSKTEIEYSEKKKQICIDVISFADELLKQLETK